MTVTAQSILAYWESIGDERADALLTEARAALPEEDEWMLRRLVLEIGNSRPERYYPLPLEAVRFALRMVVDRSSFSEHFDAHLARIFRENIAIRRLVGAEAGRTE